VLANIIIGLKSEGSDEEKRKKAELVLSSLIDMFYIWNPSIQKEEAAVQSIDEEASHFKPGYQASNLRPSKTHYLGNIVFVAFGSLDYRNQHANEYIPEKSLWNPSTWWTVIQPGDMAYPIQRRIQLELPSIEELLKEKKKQKIEEFYQESGVSIAKQEKTAEEKEKEKQEYTLAQELKKYFELKKGRRNA